MDTRQAGALGGSIGGRSRSARKAAAARANGARGGRPRKEAAVPAHVENQPAPARPVGFIIAAGRKE